MHCSTCDGGAVMICRSMRASIAGAMGSKPIATISFLPFMMETSSSRTGWPFRVACTRCSPVRRRISCGPAPPMITTSLSISTLTPGSSTLTTSVPSGVLIRRIVATNSVTWVSPAASEAPRPATASRSKARGHGQLTAGTMRGSWTRADRNPDSPTHGPGTPGTTGGGTTVGCWRWASPCSSRSATSAAVWNRSAGSLASSRSMMASSQSGMSGLSSRIDRCRSSQTRLSTAIAESARNGGRPRPWRRARRPAQNRSARASTGSPRACSGAMYCGVPAMTPLCVRLASSIARARPKSVSLTRSMQFSSRMFAGLMSRCTTPWACAAARARAAWVPIRKISLHLERARGVEPFLERAAGDVLHDEVRQPAKLIDRMDGHDVLVSDGRHGPRLAGEPAPRRRAVRQRGGEHLDRHRPVERRVACLEHHAHPTPARAPRGPRTDPAGPESPADPDRADRGTRASAAVGIVRSVVVVLRLQGAGVPGRSWVQRPARPRRAASAHRPRAGWPPPAAPAPGGRPRTHSR